MSKPKSLCPICHFHKCLRFHATDLQEEPYIATRSFCKQGLLDHATHAAADSPSPDVISCSEFSPTTLGVNIFEDRGSFLVQIIGRLENVLCSSFDQAIEVAADPLKQELDKQKEVS